MQVVIIEDEEFAARRLERMIGEIDPEIQVVAKLESVVESIKWLREEHPIDLIFMDIHLEDNSSFTIFNSVSINCPVVFTTATDEKSTAIFRQNHLDYLLKPICGEELKKILAKYNNSENQKNRSIDASILQTQIIIEIMNTSHKRKYLSASQLLTASPERVFPLLCPTREYDWIEDWKCELVFSRSGFAELDCLFATHFPDDEQEIWVVDRYEPNSVIQFIRVSVNRVIRYSIQLTNNGDGTTSAKWEQSITALTKTGIHYVEGLSNTDFEKKIKGLEIRINHFLETGKMFKSEI